MDVLQRMNSAMDYIESNLAEDIDFGEAARIACCSVNHFHRMFSFITGIPLTEYIRRRRLTLAAVELQSGSVRVIDLAVKYGYDSPDSFSRAFQKLHGVTPSSARDAGVVLKSYPKITFQIKLKGESAMDYKIVEKEAFELIGKGIMVNTENVGDKAYAFWQESNRNGMFERLKAVSTDGRDYGVTCYRHDDQSGTWSYHIACASKPGVSDSEFETLKIPALTWVVFESRTSEPFDIKKLWEKAYSEWFPSSGYTDLGGPEMEVYYPDKCELWISLKKA